MPTIMAAPAITVTNISYQYPTSHSWALHNISLNIPRGAFVGLVGPSGSGKSTLLLLLRGFQQEIGGTLKGTIRVASYDIATIPIAELGKTVGIVFQNPALQLHQLRVIDEVASAPMYQGLPYKECQKRALGILEKMLDKGYYNSPPYELSAGQQQRVALAASLSLDAEILLLDEPFSFLDETSDKELIELLSRLHQMGKTIVIATHDIGQIAPLATHIGLMNNGLLVAKGTPQEILYSNKLTAIMPPPLFIQTAQKIKLTDKPLSWKELTPKLAVRNIKSEKGRNKEKPRLTLRDISFIYPESKRGVKNVKFEIYKGEILGLIGANGSGKTTLFKLILGLVKPEKGKIFLDGKNITSLPTHQRAKDIGYVTQDPLDMFFETNLWDEVAAGPKFLNLPTPKKLAEKILKQFNLWQYKDKHPDSISGGEKSKLSIADILVNDTKVLLLDEPEFGLDPKSWQEIVALSKKLKEQGKTIIVITQDLEAALFLCDRIGVMKDGQLLKVASCVEIFKNDDLLKKAGLQPLPFSSLLANFSDRLSKEIFLESLTKK